MYILGASRHAKSVIDQLESIHLVEGVFDDNPEIISILGLEVNSPIPDTFSEDLPIHIAIGDNCLRKSISQRLPNGATYINILHNSAIVSKYARLGKGIVMMERTIVKVDTTVGNHVIINTAASIDHDCQISDFVHIAPNACLCGNVEIGEGTLVGAGSVILPGVKVGKWCVIGGGSVVHKDMPDGSKWIGSKNIC
ncbi:acetyltransferase [Rhodonellum sp.]|uniref:acetyltransferase n=1 Tax=Rhodonellum sp. TaxID=2231180 RepID=UPI0027282CBE|nr:acetyltransferase [Rhodonellum sp.]MDO9551104.1 acetyltransferase [Rhodonellum sp.]